MTESSLPIEHDDEQADLRQEHVNGWRAFATLSEFLRDDGWHPQQLDDKTIFRAYFAGENGDVRCYAQIRVDLEQFLFYVVAPVKAPEGMRAQVVEYLTRANFGLRNPDAGAHPECDLPRGAHDGLLPAGAYGRDVR